MPWKWEVRKEIAQTLPNEWFNNKFRDPAGQLWYKRQAASD